VPVHDWTRVEAFVFHHFHHAWIDDIARALNGGRLPAEYYALAEQIAGGLGPDVLTLQRPGSPQGPTTGANGSSRAAGSGSLVKTSERPPKTRFHITNEPKWFASKAKGVAIRHRSTHEVVAILEVVSPGNKNSRNGIQSFVRKAEELLTAGVHLTVIDVLPPGPRDPEGIHPLIWGEDSADAFQFDPEKPLTGASYIGGLGAEAFVESFAVGDRLPDVPLFLTSDEYVDLPLESTYQSAFAAIPDVWREPLEAPPTA
jgi:hypothetical protein